jgi:hypothetical protein
MTPVGIFVCRARGEVFLTDDDLELFERAEASVALVISGGRAGFFVREADGSVQAVRSHEEFAVASVSAALVPIIPPSHLRPTPPPNRVFTRALMGTALLCVPVAALAYLQPMLPQPAIPLTVREEAGQLIVGWKGQSELGRLEIVDGGQLTLVHLAPAQTSVTYAHRSGEVEIRMATSTKEGSARWQGAARAAPKSLDSSAVRDDVENLEREAKILRASVEGGKARVRDLARRIDRLSMH